MSPTMQSEVENTLRELRAEVRSDGAVVAGPTDLDLRAASLIERLYRENEKLREALQPFAEVASSYDPEEGDGYDIAWAHDFTIASLRRARSALAEQPQ